MRHTALRVIFMSFIILVMSSLFLKPGEFDSDSGHFIFRHPVIYMPDARGIKLVRVS